MDNVSDKYYDDKWKKVIKQLPNGGDYYFNMRQHGYNIIKGAIVDGSTVFDYACGLGVIDKQLANDKDCIVSGNDFSSVAVDYVKSQTHGDFRTTGDFFPQGGRYAYVIAIYFLEHIKEPVKWLNEAFQYTDTVIIALPNNFRQLGEHVNMQWSNWNEFKILFKDFNRERIDEGKYPDKLSNAFKHPIFKFTKGKINACIDDRGTSETTNKEISEGNEKAENEETVKDVPKKRRRKKRV